MKITTAVREYLVEIEVRKYTQKTIRSYRNNLNLFLRYCETEAQVNEIEDVSLATVRKFTAYMVAPGLQGQLCERAAEVVRPPVSQAALTYYTA